MRPFHPCQDGVSDEAEAVVAVERGLINSINEVYEYLIAPICSMYGIFTFILVKKKGKFR